MRSVNEFLPLAVAPLLGIVWAWNKLNRIHMVEAEQHLKEQEQLYLRTVETLALAVDAKDQTTYGHICRVRVYAMGLAKLNGINDPDELKAIETGSLLHDIGKLAIDDYILNKPGRLSKQEFEKIKLHAAAGDEIVQHVQLPFPAAKLVRFHHERWDGLGYPDGLKGADIPIGARILAVADAFDAIRFSRPYKLAIPMEEALDLLRAQSGTIYDPVLIKLFVENIHQLEQAAITESENMPEPSFRKYFETADRAISAEEDSSPNPVGTQDVPADLILLAEFCNTIKGHLDIEDIFPLFASRMKRLLPFSTCAFYLKDSNSDCLRTVYASGMYAEHIQGNVLGIGKGISGWVAAYKRPMINAGPALDFLDSKSEIVAFGDALVVPILLEDEALGTISVYAKDASTYSQRELNILQTLASLLAPLISESRKYEAPASDKILDPTTRIHRISYLTTVSPQMIAFAEKNKSPVSLIYLEVRNLSQIVRVYGTNSANLVLKRIADSVKPELRATDILVRFGHQGFVAFLPGVGDEQARHCVHRLRQQIKNQGSLISGQNLAVDCQAGIASYPRDGITIFALLQSAQKNIGAFEEEILAPDNNVVGFQPRG
jgi:diguanylate cyclase (GGDEF)-like protein